MVDIPIQRFAGLIFALCIYLYTSGGSPEETHLRVGHAYILLIVLVGGAFLFQMGLIILQGNIANN